MKTGRALVIVALLAYPGGDRASAVNGLQLIGFSAESTALGGSGHVAVADTSSINTNPAALSLIGGTRIDVSAGPLQAYVHHSDQFGNDDVAGHPDVTALGDLGVATRFAALPRLIAGAGLFTQGGFGTDYKNLGTAFGNQDETSSFLRYLKLAVGLSYELTDTLSIGVAPSVGYSDISLRLFPHTSVAPSPRLPTGFAGLDIRDDCSKSGGLGSLVHGCPSDFVASVKVGAMYRPSSWLTLGATYTSPVEFAYGDGRAGIDLAAVGLGRVNYDARVSGIPWPQQVDASMATRPTERLLLTLTASWMNWSALGDVHVSATHPANPAAPSRIDLRIPFDWKDMYVTAVGASYTAMREPSWSDPDRLVLSIGYNHSNNPIPKHTLSPLAPLVLENHFTGGFGFRLTESWAYDLGAIYALTNRVTYTNPSLPFGPSARESISAYYAYNTLSYRF